MAGYILGYIPDESDSLGALGTPTSGDLSNCSGTAVALTVGKTQAINDVVVAATAPTTGQAIFALSPTTASWADVPSKDTTCTDANTSSVVGTGVCTASYFVATGTTAANKIPCMAVAPNSAQVGDTFFNTTTNYMNYYTPGGWYAVVIASGGGQLNEPFSPIFNVGHEVPVDNGPNPTGREPMNVIDAEGQICTASASFASGHFGGALNGFTTDYAGNWGTPSWIVIGRYDVGGTYLFDDFGNVTIYDSGPTAQGEYIQIQFATTAKPVYKYRIYMAGDVTTGPNSFILLGSQNGTDWDSMHTEVTGYTPPAAYSVLETLTTNTASYTYYRLVVTRARTSVVNIVELEMFMYANSPSRTNLI